MLYTIWVELFLECGRTLHILFYKCRLVVDISGATGTWSITTVYCIIYVAEFTLYHSPPIGWAKGITDCLNLRKGLSSVTGTKTYEVHPVSHSQTVVIIEPVYLSPSVNAHDKHLSGFHKFYLVNYLISVTLKVLFRLCKPIDISTVFRIKFRFVFSSSLWDTCWLSWSTLVLECGGVIDVNNFAVITGSIQHVIIQISNNASTYVNAIWWVLGLTPLIYII